MQAKYDSIFKAQHEEFNAVLDQIQLIPMPVEKPLSKWEHLKQEVGGIAIGIHSINRRSLAYTKDKTPAVALD